MAPHPLPHSCPGTTIQAFRESGARALWPPPRPVGPRTSPSLAHSLPANREVSEETAGEKTKQMGSILCTLGWGRPGADSCIWEAQKAAGARTPTASPHPPKASSSFPPPRPVGFALLPPSPWQACAESTHPRAVVLGTDMRWVHSHLNPPSPPSPVTAPGSPLPPAKKLSFTGRALPRGQAQHRSALQQPVAPLGAETPPSLKSQQQRGRSP